MPDFRATYRNLYWQLQPVTPEARRYSFKHFAHSGHWGSFYLLIPPEAAREFDNLQSAGFSIDLH